MGNEVINNFKNYEKLAAWQKSFELVTKVYGITALFPKEEIHGLVSQMRRCSVSIPSNIAEGSRRGSILEFRHFLNIARGSGAELETQVKIAQALGYAKSADYVIIENTLDEVMKLLSVMVKNPRTIS